MGNAVVADFVLPDVTLQCGRLVRSLRLRYQDHGEPPHGRGRGAILFPTWFGATHTSNGWIVGPGRALDTDRYRVIVVNALGNGASSSPSNEPQLMEGSRPVPISLLDNVLAQRALLDALGVQRVRAVVGRSMGAQVALQWGCRFPRDMDRIVAFCGTAATTPHNRVLLDAMAAAIEHSPDGRGIALAARVYASAVLSPDFFNLALWRGRGSDSESAWIEAQVVAGLQRMAAMDVLCLLRSWREASVAANPRFGGDLSAALGAIEAPTLLIPIDTDAIFRPQDIVPMAKQIAPSLVWTLRSPWGHRAAAPHSDPHDIRRLEAVLRRFLDTDGTPIDAELGVLRPF